MSKFLFFVVVINVVVIAYNVVVLNDFGAFEEEFSVSKNFSVVVPESLYDQLSFEFVTSGDEFIYCFYGNVTGGDVFVERMSVPEVLLSNSTVVKHYPCEHSFDYLGNVHSHPNGVCSFSGADLFNFGGDDSLLKCLVCGSDKFGCVSKYDVDKLVEVKIK